MALESTTQAIWSSALSRAAHPGLPRRGAGWVCLTVKHAASWSTVGCSGKIVFFLSFFFFIIIFSWSAASESQDEDPQKKTPSPPRGACDGR